MSTAAPTLLDLVEAERQQLEACFGREQLPPAPKSVRERFLSTQAELRQFIDALDLQPEDMVASLVAIKIRCIRLRVLCEQLLEGE